jgi:hypothetical protein
MIPEYGSVIVSWDYSRGKDKTIAVVGRKTQGQEMKIINAFEGDDAIALVEMLHERKTGVILDEKL